MTATHKIIRKARNFARSRALRSERAASLASTDSLAKVHWLNAQAHRQCESALSQELIAKLDADIARALLAKLDGAQ